jgi:hypothetical protein
MRTVSRSISYVLCTLFALCLCVFAMSSTSQIAAEGQLIPKASVETHGWPAGVLDLVNDPLRSDGWNPWFSEWPNDVNHYEMKLHGQDDLEQIIQKLVAIRCDVVRIRLDPGKEPSALGFTTELPKGNGAAAVFAIGSQKIIDQWYLRLPEIEPGIRKFGVHRYTECPKALPPTLTLFVGNSGIDLAKLKVPMRIQVSDALSDSYRKEHESDPLVNAIDKFITEHGKKQEAAQKRNKETK